MSDLSFSAGLDFDEARIATQRFFKEVEKDAAGANIGVGGLESRLRGAGAGAGFAEEKMAALGAAIAQVAEAGMRATSRLEDFANVGDPVTQLTTRYARLHAEIDRLEEVSGNSDLAARARIAINRDLADGLVDLKRRESDAAVGLTQFGEHATVAAERTVNTRMAVSQLLYQAQDAYSQLSMGMSPFQVMIQQGGDLGLVLSQLGVGMSSVVGILGRLVAPVGALSLVVAGLGTAWIVTANAAQDAEQDALDHAHALLELGDNAEEAAKRLRELNDATRGSLDAQTQAGLRLAELRGDLTDYEAEAAGAAATLRSASKERLTALQAELAANQEAISANDRIANSEKSLAEERAAALSALPALRKKRFELSQAAQDERDSVDALAGALQAEIIAQGQAEEAERAAEKARRASAAAAESEEAFLRRLNAALEENQRRVLASAAAYNDLIAGMNAAEQDANNAIFQRNATTIQKLRAAEAERVQELSDNLRTYLANGEVTLAARETAEQEHGRAVAAIHADTADSIASARAEAELQVEGILAKSSAAQMSAVDRLYAAKSDALTDYMTLARDMAFEEQQIAADRAEIIAGYNQQIQDAQVAQAFQTIELIQQNAQQLAGMLTAALDEAYTASVDTASRLTAQLIAGQEYYTDAQEEQLKKRIDAEKKAAIKAFNVSKGIKMADAMMSAGLAAVNAFQSAMATVPYPANMVVAPVSAGVALGMGIAQAAVISQQQPAIAHRGAFVEDLAPDETMIKATRKEVVLSPVARDQIGDETIQRAQAGQGGGTNREVIVVDRYRHETFNRFAKDNLKMQSPMSDAVGNAGTRQAGPG